MSATQPIARRSDDPAPARESELHSDPQFAELERALAADWGNDRMPPPAPAAFPASASSEKARRTSSIRDYAPAVDALHAAAGSAPPLPAPGAPTSARRRWPQVSTFRLMAMLGAIGFVVGAGSAGLYAWRMGYDWRLAAQIGVVAGIASGAALSALPPLARALGWTLLAGALGAVAAGALWRVTRIAPAMVERIIH
jgi:hypothetical protein